MEEKKGHGKVDGFEITRDGRRTSYCKFLRTEVTAVAKTGSDPFSSLITKVVRSLLFLFFPSLALSFFFSRSSGPSNCIFADRQWHIRCGWPAYRALGRSLIAFPLLFANDSNDQEPPRWPILHGGGKVTAGSTCSVLLRRNYFPNSICSKFGAPADIPRKFLKEKHAFQWV